MVAQDSQQYVNLIERFSLLEKILMRIGFYGFIIIGAYGIYSVSITWGHIHVLLSLDSFLSSFIVFALTAHTPINIQPAFSYHRDLLKNYIRFAQSG